MYEAGQSTAQPERDKSFNVRWVFQVCAIDDDYYVLNRVLGQSHVTSPAARGRELAQIVRELERAREKGSVDGLTFDQFSTINRKRCEGKEGFAHSLDSWSISDWFVAMVGELGEAANVAKKLNRIRDGIPGNGDATEEDLQAEFRDEIADTFIYLDLIAQSQGINLARAIVDKFNRTSDKIGSSIKVIAEAKRETAQAGEREQAETAESVDLVATFKAVAEIEGDHWEGVDADKLVARFRRDEIEWQPTDDQVRDLLCLLNVEITSSNVCTVREWFDDSQQHIPAQTASVVPWTPESVELGPATTMEESAAKVIRDLKADLAEKDEEITALVKALERIHAFAHERSQGPEVHDPLWEIREMAKDAL